MTEHVVRKLSFSGRLWLVAIGSMAVLAQSVWGQSSATPSGAVPPVVTTDAKVPVFEVVSVKQDKSESGMIRVMTKPDGYSATNISLKMLVQAAYGIREDLISGAPGWADSARYDIDAKVAGPDVDELKKLSNEQRRSMLKPLLEERFKLKVHTETKQLPIYELVLAKGGSKLKEATPGDTYPNGFKGPDGAAHGGMVRMSHGQLTGQAVPIATLVNLLSQRLQRTVTDKTELTGKYDLELNWTPAEGEGGGIARPQAGSEQQDTSPPIDSGPSLFTALQEQLGLRLQSSKGPVETLVIDHVEMPTEN
jgi:uncharacterized protein (TIGR03435 family)